MLFAARQVCAFSACSALLCMFSSAHVLRRARQNLSDAWLRHLLWRRAADATPEQRESLRKALFTDGVEACICKCWSWYEPMMFQRRLQQFLGAKDRADILAIDGNAKLHRRTCGMPFAESLYSEELDLYLLRGCSCRPIGKSTLCTKHQSASEVVIDDPCAPVIASHRLKRSLHKIDDVCNLEVLLEGCSRRWQPSADPL